VGMSADLYKTSRRAKEVFDLIDNSLSFSLSKLMFEGPAPELEKTVNSQPAIMAASLASLAAFEECSSENQSKPMAFAGHSLGEYTSLVAAGVVDIGDGVRLVRERGKLMQAAAERQSGSMAAVIGLDEITLEEVCQETGVEIANVNSADQIVISGDCISMARAVDLASARGARKAVPLSVAGAFHSHLMAPAQEGLCHALEETNFRDPTSPIVGNIMGTYLITANQVKEELKLQLCSCVQWKQSIRSMIDMGVSTFIEFGPSRVLTSLVKRIDRQVTIANVVDMASAQKVVQEDLPS
jgi:[acyl-carrier-protein] S-malonyltransferase